MPAPRLSIGPEFRSKISTAAPLPCRASPAQRPPMEPPATTARKFFKLLFCMGQYRFAQTRCNQFRLECAGTQWLSIENEGRNAGYPGGHQGLLSMTNFVS